MQEDASFTTSTRIENLPELESAADAVIEETRTFDYPLSEGVTLRVFSQNEKINLPARGGRRLRCAAANSCSTRSLRKRRVTRSADPLTIFERPFTIAGFMALPNYIYPLQSDTDLMYSAQSFGIAVIPKADFAALDHRHQLLRGQVQPGRPPPARAVGPVPRRCC